MQPVLKGLSSLDLPDGQSLPDDPSNCVIRMTARVGTPNTEGGDNFHFRVVTPRSLEGAGATPQWGRGDLIVHSFEWQAVETSLDDLLARCSAPTWEEIATNLSRFTHWEFEDYTE